MATLVSPGVNVSVVDESAYGAPGAGTVPLLLVATRQDKTDPTGSEADGIAKQTKSAVAGNVVKVTSQRELTQFLVIRRSLKVEHQLYKAVRPVNMV